MWTIAIANQKGGTAKTTTVACLGILLSRLGVRVHLVDMDPQASLSFAFGHRDESERLYHSIRQRAGLPVDEISDHLSLSPGGIEMARLEAELLSETGREHYLQTCFRDTRLPSDTIVLIDCPPSLDVLTINCLAAAQSVLIPVQPGGFEIHALSHLEWTLRVMRERINPNTATIGVVLTNCHSRRAITERVADELSQFYPVLSRIPTDAKLLYATSQGTVANLRSTRALSEYDRVAHFLLEHGCQTRN